jgi:hypothetical protein
MRQPKMLECPAHIGKRVCARRFDQKCICPELVGASNVALVNRRGEDDHDQTFERGLLADEFEHFQTHLLRELQIEQDEAGQGKLLSISEFSGSGQIIDRFLSIHHYVHRVVDLHAFEHVLEQEYVLLAIFDMQNWPVDGHVYVSGSNCSRRRQRFSE